MSHSRVALTVIRIVYVELFRILVSVSEFLLKIDSKKSIEKIYKTGETMPKTLGFFSTCSPSQCAGAGFVFASSFPIAVEISANFPDGACNLSEPRNRNTVTRARL